LLSVGSTVILQLSLAQDLSGRSLIWSSAKSLVCQLRTRECLARGHLVLGELSRWACAAGLFAKRVGGRGRVRDITADSEREPELEPWIEVRSKDEPYIPFGTVEVLDDLGLNQRGCLAAQPGGKHGGAEVSCASVTSCAAPGSRPITHIPSSLDTDGHRIGSVVSPSCHIVAPGRNSDRHVTSQVSRVNGVCGVVRTSGEVTPGKRREF
jgi:hypothetical protein